MGLRSGTTTPDNSDVVTVLRYGPNPVTADEIGQLDNAYGSRLAGRAGHIPIGDPFTLKRTGPLPAQQAFVGAQQLTNLLNAKIGFATAIPATKPNPGVVPLTQMQLQLAAMNQ